MSFGERGGPSYEDLVAQGVEVTRHQERPSQATIVQEAEKIAKIEMKDAYDTVAQRSQEVNKVVYDRFQNVVNSNDSTTLKGTLWEKWTVEDCRSLLEAINLVKMQIALEKKMPELQSVAYEDRVTELQQFVDENQGRENIDGTIEKIDALMKVIESIVLNEPGSTYHLKNYAGWSPEELQRFKDDVLNLKRELKDAARMMTYDDRGDY